MLRLTHWHVTLYRVLGYHERADAIQRADAAADAGPSRTRDDSVDSGEEQEAPAASASGGSAPTHTEHSAHGHAAGGSDSGHASGGGDSAHAESGDSHGSTAHASADAESSSSHGCGSGGEHADASHDSAAAHASAAVDGHDPHGLLHDPHHGAHDDIESNPLGGIRSARLADSIQREAFFGASTDAQDSAIREAARAMLAHVRFPPTPDLSWTAQQERIAALDGALPDFARGNPVYDPSAPGFVPDTPLREVSPAAPAATHDHTPDLAPARASESRTRGFDMDR